MIRSACLGVSLWKQTRHRKDQVISFPGWFPCAENADWHTCSWDLTYFPFDEVAQIQNSQSFYRQHNCLPWKMQHCSPAGPVVKPSQVKWRLLVLGAFIALPQRASWLPVFIKFYCDPSAPTSCLASVVVTSFERIVLYLCL